MTLIILAVMVAANTAATIHLAMSIHRLATAMLKERLES